MTATEPRPLCAKFNGTCIRCLRPYDAGDQILKIGYKRYVHESCSVPALPSSENGTAAAAIDDETIRKIVRHEIDQCDRTAPKQVIEVRLPDGKVTQLEEQLHPKFEQVLSLAVCRRNILLVGPAGCGKSHLCEQVAKALGLRFGFISVSAGMSEGSLLGRLIPTGEAGKFEYHISRFVDCYENGGVFLLDEIDAADSNVLLVINSALANGHLAIPARTANPVAKRHPDFVCIAAANTFGTGADRQYVGRNQLDESTLDRFRIGQVVLDYDAKVEEFLCPDEELRDMLQGYRRAARAAKLRRVISSRFLRDAFTMKSAGWTHDQINEALFSGWSADEVAKVSA
jgi:hypothetical protein